MDAIDKIFSKIRFGHYSIKRDAVEWFVIKFFYSNDQFILATKEQHREELKNILRDIESEIESPVIFIEFNEKSLDWDCVIIPIAQALIEHINQTGIKNKTLTNYLEYLEYVIINKDHLDRSQVESTLELIDKIPNKTGKDLYIVFTNFQHMLKMKTSFYRPDGVMRGIFQHFGEKVSLNMIIDSNEAMFKIFHDREAPFYYGGVLHNIDPVT